MSHANACRAMEVAILSIRHRQQPHRRRQGERKILTQIERRQLRCRQRPVGEVIVHEQSDVNQDDRQRRLGAVRNQNGGRILVLADGADRQQNKDAVDQKPEVRRKGRRLYVVVTRLP